MIMSVRLKLIMLFSLTVGSLLLSAILMAYLHFVEVLKDNEISEFFDTELFEYSLFIKEHLASRRVPEDLDLTKDKKFFRIAIEEEVIFEHGYVQLRNFPKQYSDSPTFMIKNLNLESRDIPLTKKAYKTIQSGAPYFENGTISFHPLIRVVTYLVHDKNGVPYILQLGASVEGVRKGVQALNKRVIGSSLILLTIITILGIFFVKQSFAPIKKMVALTRKITAEDLSHRIEFIKGNDEVGELAVTLNSMIEGLEQSFIRIKQFSDDVSHELKTPLTVLRGELEVALRKKRESAEYRDILESVLQETHKLENIIEGLFFLSRLEDKSYSVNFTSLELDEILIEVYEKQNINAREKDINLVLERVDEVVIEGNAELLKRVISNLISNAIRYSNSSSKIEVSLQAGLRSRLIVSDSGQGIPEESLDKIFDRFYRVDKSRSSLTGGAGLGLSIVKKILDLHDAKIMVKSKPGKGTEFIVEF